MDRKLKRSLGKVVCGDTFWGRTKEKKLFIEKIQEGANLLLTAQRRMGKTSLLRETEEELKDQIVCLFVDLQDSENARDAIVEISKRVYEKYPSMWKKISGIFGRIVEGIESIGVGELGIKLRAGLTLVGKLTQAALIAFGESYALKNNSNEEIMTIIWVLQHDGYLMDKSGNYVFVSKLLRDWWKARNEKFYIPIGHRKAK